MRILAIDYGTRRVGLAVSDPTGTLASPLETLVNTGHRKLIDDIATIVSEVGAERVLIGVPARADESFGETARRVLSFARKLAMRLTVPVTSIDEAFTTAEALDRLAQTPGKRARTVLEQRKIVDQVAAALLLEEYLADLPAIPSPLPDPGPAKGEAEGMASRRSSQAGPA